MFYIFHSETKEFLTETVGQRDPLGGEGAVFTPANATLIAPAPVAQYEMPVWNIDTEAWITTLDNRDRIFWNKASKEQVIFALGDAVTAAMTSIMPNYDPMYVWDETLGDWSVPVDTAKTLKYAEIYAYADSLIVDNEATFFTKGNDNLVRNKDRLSKAQSQRDKKKIADTPLTPTEEAADERYDSLMDWADSVYDTADTSEDTVELMATTAEVEAYIVETMPVWPVWSPPV